MHIYEVVRSTDEERGGRNSEHQRAAAVANRHAAAAAVAIATMMMKMNYNYNEKFALKN